MKIHINCKNRFWLLRHNVFLDLSRNSENEKKSLCCKDYFCFYVLQKEVKPFEVSSMMTAEAIRKVRATHILFLFTLRPHSQMCFFQETGRRGTSRKPKSTLVLVKICIVKFTTPIVVDAKRNKTTIPDGEKRFFQNEHYLYWLNMLMEM